MIHFKVSFDMAIDELWIEDGFDGKAIAAAVVSLEENMNEFAVAGVEVKVSNVKVSKGVRKEVGGQK
jgi:hypothetical protein